MKNFIPDLILMILISGTGFIFSWWSIFMICFFWGYLQLARPSKIFVVVWICQSALILYFGMGLLQMLNFSNMAQGLDPIFFRILSPYVIPYVIASLVGLVFAAVSGLFARTGFELQKTYSAGK